MTIKIRSLIVLCLPFGTLVAQSLQITSPADGTVVNPGQLLTVSVAASGSFQEVIVVGETPVGSSQQSLNAPPYQFTIQVPTAISPRQYALTALGFTGPDQIVNSNPVVIDIERPDNPISIRVEPTILVLTPGENGYLRILGLFNDGTTLDLTQSTLITYTSNATGVATVATYGVVTGVASGSATVTASYGGLSIGVPVTVPQPITVAPPRKALYASQTEQFIVQLAGLSNPSIVWSINPSGAGSIDGTGFYTAPSSISTQQTVTVTATNAADNMQFATATVLLYPPAAVTIQPTTASLSASQTQPFTTGVTNAPIAGVSFSISPSGTGTIDTSGLYTAPSSIATQQVATLTATSWVDSTKFASATITLNPPPNGYLYHRTITIAHTKVPNTDQTNFPSLFNSTDPLLKTVANGGHVQNVNGYDIIFTSDAAGTVKLDHEIESYNAITGQFVAWLRIPTLSHTTDTVIYLFYGNSSITISQENKTGVWNSDYKGVWHLPNGSTLTANDSTSNGNNGSITSATATAGQIDGGGSFDGSSANINLGTSSTLQPTTAGTVSLWLKANSFSNYWATPMANENVSTDRNGYGVYFNRAGAATFELANVLDRQGVTSSALSSGQWYYIVGTWNNTTIFLYVNGVLSAQTGILLTPTYSAPLRLGVDGAISSVNEYFSGTLDEARVSDIARSADWITAEYNNQSSPTTFYTLSGEL